MSIQDEVNQLVPGFHQLKFEEDVYSPGQTPYQHLLEVTDLIKLKENIYNKTVLDIGAWDGFYSFFCEENGAREVTAMDHFVWEREYLNSDLIDKSLPGKKCFDLYRKHKNSKVKSIYSDFMQYIPSAGKQYDIVLFIGVLYHIDNQYGALKKIYDLTKEKAIISTHAMMLPGLEHMSLFEFYPFSELNGDRTNWFSPNEKALLDLCLSVGFKRAEVINKYMYYQRNGNTYYRLVVHASKE